VRVAKVVRPYYGLRTGVGQGGYTRSTSRAVVWALVRSVVGDTWAKEGREAGVVCTANVWSKIFRITCIDPSSNIGIFWIWVIRRDAVMKVACWAIGL